MFLVQFYLKFYLNYDGFLVGTGQACFETLRPLTYSIYWQSLFIMLESACRRYCLSLDLMSLYDKYIFLSFLVSMLSFRLNRLHLQASMLRFVLFSRSWMQLAWWCSVFPLSFSFNLISWDGLISCLISIDKILTWILICCLTVYIPHNFRFQDFVVDAFSFLPFFSLWVLTMFIIFTTFLCPCTITSCSVLLTSPLLSS